MRHHWTTDDIRSERFLKKGDTKFRMIKTSIGAVDSVFYLEPIDNPKKECYATAYYTPHLLAAFLNSNNFLPLEEDNV